MGQAGYDLVIVDDLSTGRKSSILYGRHIQEDIGNTVVMEKIIKGGTFDACLHFAGSIVVPESVKNPLKYYLNNTRKTLDLLELCSRYGVNKFIFSSTAAVYGLPENGLCTEETPTNPINPYGRSKLMTEWALEDLSMASSLRYIALRYFNVAGANVGGLLGQCGPNSTHLLKVASEAAVGKRDKMNIFGTDYPTFDGTCIRDYIHVDDLAMAHLNALDYLNDGGHSAVFNCGYGRGYSVKEVIAAVKKVAGVDFLVENTDRREGDASKLIAATDKILAQTSWRPRYNDLELIVKTAWEWEKKL